MNKKNIILISIILVVVILLFILINNLFGSNVSFYLNGEYNVKLVVNTKYDDPLYICTDSKNNDLSQYVTIKDEVNYNSIGNYKIIYTYKKGLKTIKLERNIEIVPNEIENGGFTLIGDNPYYLLLNYEYNDPGYKFDNTISKVKVNSNVDITKTGEYDVNYVLSYLNSEKTITRKVIVFDFSTEIKPDITTETTKDVTINIKNNDNTYSYTLLPDGNKNYEKDIKFVVKNNDKYKFVVYDKNGCYKEFSIDITNIKRDYTCTGTIDRYGTNIKLNTSDYSNISGYTWKINGKNISGNKEYKNERYAYDKASVLLTFKDKSTFEVSCSIKNNLVYRFKYDKDNKKEFMKCGTYSASDKTRLDAMLKKAVEEAGYGTRAGTVEAYRFLVGALDYKVPYLGPKAVNSALGRYQKIGLNIGTSDSWGCSVSGWTQGMDCTNSVSWAEYQNGINVGTYSTGNTYPSADVLDKIQVGDFMYTYSSTTKNESGFSHIGIVIGIDDKNIYVGESTTGNVNAIIVSTWPKSGFSQNNARSHKFGYTHLTKYPSEGNVTKMWVE